MGLPRILAPIITNATCLTSCIRRSSVSITVWGLLRLHRTLFRTSLFAIFRCHLICAGFSSVYLLTNQWQQAKKWCTIQNNRLITDLLKGPTARRELTLCVATVSPGLQYTQLFEKTNIHRQHLITNATNLFTSYFHNVNNSHAYIRMLNKRAPQYAEFCCYADPHFNACPYMFLNPSWRPLTLSYSFHDRLSTITITRQ